MLSLWLCLKSGGGHLLPASPRSKEPLLVSKVCSILLPGRTLRLLLFRIFASYAAPSVQIFSRATKVKPRVIRLLKLTSSAVGVSCCEKDSVLAPAFFFWPGNVHGFSQAQQFLCLAFMIREQDIWVYPAARGSELISSLNLVRLN